MSQKTHIAMLISPGIGHLHPFLALAKDLISHHDLTVTVIITTVGPPSAATTSIIDSLPQGIEAILLPPITFDKTMIFEAQTFQAIKKSLLPFRNVFESFFRTEKPVAALVVDLFGSDGFEIAREFNVPCYVFAFSAMVMAHFLSHSKVEETTTFNNFEPVKLPGCILANETDLPPTVRDPESDTFKLIRHHSEGCRSADGVILNSFMELEPDTIAALQEENVGKPIFYPIGPRLQNSLTGSEVDQFGCLDWLNRHPVGSVLFISFGSGGTLSVEQLTELALGLEMSEERFLWAVKGPNEKSALGSYFNMKSETDPFGFLPEGFLDRTEKKGLVTSSWAPQLEILSHKSTAGFLTHCGWNSIIESTVNGIPMIAWPLFAEQPLNALLLTKGLKVALRPKSSENGLVGREEIASTIKSLMKEDAGMKIRKRMNALKEAAAKAITKDGSSTKILSELVLKWKNKNYI